MPASTREASADYLRPAAYALTGQLLDAPDGAPEPDPTRLSAALDRTVPGGLAAVRRYAVTCRAEGRPWPHPVPPELRPGIGAAQWLAVLTGLIAALDLPPARAGVGADRPLTEDEARLMREVPPHHGT